MKVEELKPYISGWKLFIHWMWKIMDDLDENLGCNYYSCSLG
jgi:hypothetical protein